MNLHFAKRLTWRVGLGIATWFLAYAPQLEDGQRARIREAAVSVVVISITAWVARQGHRVETRKGS